jgi:hypothetical protein
MSKSAKTPRCESCRTTEVDTTGDYCYGCRRIVCLSCIDWGNHRGSGAHALRGRRVSPAKRRPG